MSARSRVTVLIVLAAIVLLVLYERESGTVWTGAIDVQIEFEESHPRPGKIFLRRCSEGEAAFLLDETPSVVFDKVFDLESCFLSSFNTQMVTLPIVMSGHVTELGRERNFNYKRFLFVLGEWPDGSRRAKVVAIPDPRISKTFRIALP